MKCIKCGEDNKLKERQENKGCCKKCQHPFTFDPKLNDKFTDQFFEKTLAAISVNDSLSFTPRQFYYFISTRKKIYDALGGGIVLLIVSIPLSFFCPIGFILGPAAFLVGSYFVITALRERALGRVPGFTGTQVKSFLDRWEKKNGALKKMLPPPQQHALPAAINPEVTAYSFDRAVICDRNELAHFLIANNFHFENNCAVLSVNGYPQNIFETVLAMLKKNPDLKVYALHDASPSGVQLVHRLRTQSRWFADSAGIAIFDVGLLPRQLLKKKMFVLRTNESAVQAKAIPAEVKAMLQADEIKWLEEGRHVELESLAPMFLLRILREGIAKSRNPEANDALVVVGDSGYYGSDVSVYSVDSFG